MASSKAKAGVLGESGPLKEAKGAGGAPPAGEAAANSRSYSLEELDTVATVGEYRAGLRGPSGPDPHTERERGAGGSTGCSQHTMSSSANMRAQTLLDGPGPGP